jgi:ubiquinone/menaquinone biosynthesis C-methylase UbiE
MTRLNGQSEIVTAYNEWAETYDTVQNRTRDLAAKALQQSGLKLADRSVVEIGCGTGRNTEWVIETAAGIVGLDFSEEMLTRARTRVVDQRVHFVQHDVRSPWPLEDNSADVAIAMLVLEHVEYLGPVFLEAARVLRAGGELFISELHPARQLLGNQARFTNVKTGEKTLVTAFLHVTEDYLQAAAMAGFEVVKLAEWRDEDADAPQEPPRLLSIHFQMPGK